MIHETVRCCFECAHRFKGLITYRWSKHCTPKDYLPSVSICVHQIWCVMMMSSNGNIFRVTGPLWRKSTGHRWIPFTKASDAELWCFLWPAPEQTAEKMIETPVIWDAIAFVMTKSEKYSLSHKRGKYSKRINECPPKLQYIPRNMHTVFALLCFVEGYTLTDFPISIRLTSLALWQSNDCPSASKATLMNIDKYFMWIHYERLHNHNKAKHNKTVCIFHGIYCTTGHIHSFTIEHSCESKSNICCQSSNLVFCP